MPDFLIVPHLRHTALFVVVVDVVLGGTGVDVVVVTGVDVVVVTRVDVVVVTRVDVVVGTRVDVVVVTRVDVVVRTMVVELFPDDRCVGMHHHPKS